MTTEPLLQNPSSISTAETARTSSLTAPLVLADLLTQAQAPGDKKWETFQPGVERCWLYQQKPDGPAAALLRFQPGGRVPLHEHVGYEHILILSGSQQDERGIYPAGTLLISPPGTRHSILSGEGCTVLAIYEKPVRFLA